MSYIYLFFDEYYLVSILVMVLQAKFTTNKIIWNMDKYFQKHIVPLKKA